MLTSKRQGPERTVCQSGSAPLPPPLLPPTGGECGKGIAPTALTGRQGVCPVIGGLCSAPIHSVSQAEDSTGPQTTVSLLWPKDRNADDPDSPHRGHHQESWEQRLIHPALHKQNKAVMATYKWASSTAAEKEACYLDYLGTDYLGTDTFQDCLKEQKPTLLRHSPVRISFQLL